MRTIFLTSAFLILCIDPNFSQPKKTQFGVKTGINISIFSASINSESAFKTGFHFGAFMRTRIAEKFFFRPELDYSSQGQKDNYMSQPGGSSTGTTTTSVNYLNLPMLVEFGNKLCIQTGIQPGMLLSAHEKGTIDNVPINDDLKNIMNSVDVAFVIGLGLHPSDHACFGFRYNSGMNSIFNETPAGIPEIKNRVFHLYIGYTF